LANPVQAWPVAFSLIDHRGGSNIPKKGAPMLTVRKLRYLTSAAAASLVLVAAAGDKFGDQLLSTTEFVHTAQVNNGGVIGGGSSGGNGGVNNGGVIGGGTSGGNNGGVISGGANSAGPIRSGPTSKPR
jgi:uncharacterized membrane protein